MVVVMVMVMVVVMVRQQCSTIYLPLLTAVSLSPFLNFICSLQKRKRNGYLSSFLSHDLINRSGLLPLSASFDLSLLIDWVCACVWVWSLCAPKVPFSFLFFRRSRSSWEVWWWSPHSLLFSRSSDQKLGLVCCCCRTAEVCLSTGRHRVILFYRSFWSW